MIGTLPVSAPVFFLSLTAKGRVDIGMRFPVG